MGGMTNRDVGTGKQGADDGEGKDPLLGKVLGGRFRILSGVARGGMGKIYRAEQSPLNRVVALKVLDPATTDDSERSVFRERFFLEASTCAKLTHPNTLRIFDYGSTWDEVYFIAMEYLQGRTLQQIIRSESPLAPLRVLRIMKQICGSLAEAHSRGVIHRDLKPSNIMLTRHGEHEEFVKVLDFGLVKRIRDTGDMTDAGRLLGSPMYMSPEQVKCQALDVRSDIYALGVVMYVALTGKRPFKKTSSVSVLLSQIKEIPPAFEVVRPGLDLPQNLEWVVMTCLKKKREDRFASVRELLRAVRICEKQIVGGLTDPPAFKLLDGHMDLPIDFESVDTGSVAPVRRQSGQEGDDSHSVNIEMVTTGRTRSGLFMMVGFSAAGVITVMATLMLVILLVLLISLWGTNNGSGDGAVSGEPATAQPESESDKADGAPRVEVGNDELPPAEKVPTSGAATATPVRKPAARKKTRRRKPAAVKVKEKEVDVEESAESLWGDTETENVVEPERQPENDGTLGPQTPDNGESTEPEKEKDQTWEPQSDIRDPWSK